MSQKTRDKMKKKLEKVFNALVTEEDMIEMGENAEDYCEEISGLTSLVDAYTKLEAIDQKKEELETQKIAITAQQIAVETFVNAIKKNSTPIDWKN